MRCPRCGSDNIQYVSNVRDNGPSFSKGCCGWILFGPVGLLCSLCGNGQTREEFWVCRNCGKKF